MKGIITQVLKHSLLTCLLSFSLIAANSSASDLSFAKRFVVTLDEPSGSALSKSQKDAAAAGDSESFEMKFGVSLLEDFRAENQHYAILSAINKASLEGYLSSLNISPQNIVETEFTNSPAVGGGPTASDTPKVGHKIYVIERGVPGISELPLEKQREISHGSQQVVAEFGDSLEWDRSFLTKVGTFCVYRTDDESKILEHASIAGFPADKVSSVEQTVYNFDFRQQ